MANESKPSSKLYATIFSVLILVLLISFVWTPDLSLVQSPVKFRGHNQLVNLYTSLRYQIGDRVFHDTLVGEQGWLFYNEDIPDYQKSSKLKRKTLNQVRRELTELHKNLAQQGITLLVVVAPNKGTIYPDHMPAQIPVLGEDSRFDQFIAYMNGSEVPILDLRPTLLAQRGTQDLYFKTDSHWNDYGAYYAYVEIMDALSTAHPALTPHPLSDFEYQKAGASNMDLARLMGLFRLKEEEWALVPKFEVSLDETRDVASDRIHAVRTVTNQDPDLPEVLVYQDSFYWGLAHFMEPHFSKVTTIPFSARNTGVWSLEWIEREQPDIVILEVAERFLDLSLPSLLGE